MTDYLGLIIEICLPLILSLGIFLCFYASNRFMGQLWSRLQQSHIFTLLQLIINRRFLFGLLLIVGGILVTVFGYPNDELLIVEWAFVLVFFSLCGLWVDRKNSNSSVNNQYYIMPAAAPKIKFGSELGEMHGEFQLLEKGFNAVYQKLQINLIPPIYKMKSWFAIPGSKYPSPYLWDSSFISGAWRIRDDRMAQEILRPFLDLQRDDGMCPQNILLGMFPNYNITNPPLLAFAMLQAAQMCGDEDLLQQYYPAFQKYEQYLEKTHQDQGLFKWIHSYESGIDNSPRFTNQSELEKHDLSHLWAIDFNVWMVLHYTSMQRIAEILENTEDSEEYARKANNLATLIQEYLWDDETGLFYDFDYAKKEFIKINTIFSLFPLYLGITTPDQTALLIQHIQNPEEYNTRIPFPTVARNDPLFVKDTWRGPMWVNTAWIPLQGIFKANQGELGGELAYRLVKGVYETYENCGSFYEFYDPDEPTLAHLDRKKGNLGKALTLGNKPIHNFCGWTALINTILIENIIGYHRLGNKIEFIPHIPQSWLGTTIELDIPQYKEFITIESHTDGNIVVSIKNESNTLKMDGWNHATLTQSE